MDALQQVEANFQDRRFLFRSQLTVHASQIVRATGVAVPPIVVAKHEILDQGSSSCASTQILRKKIGRRIGARRGLRLDRPKPASAARR